MTGFINSKQRLSQVMILLGLMMCVFGIDQLVKQIVQNNLATGESITVIPEVFQWTLTYNTGAAFSIFSQNTELLTFFTGIIFLALLLFGLIKSLSKKETFFVGFILGGASGNLYDRITIAKVVDFIDVTAINYPIFNLADSFIFIGVVGLIWHQLFCAGLFSKADVNG